MNTIALNFQTSYHQFYLFDQDSSLDTGNPDFWNSSAFGEGILGIGIGSYGLVKSEIAVLPGRPLLNENEWDHIVEGSVNIKSGILKIMNCPESTIVLEKQVKPDTYRVRILSKNLISVIGDNGNDFYRIETWPEPYSQRVVQKRFK